MAAEALSSDIAVSAGPSLTAEAAALNARLEGLGPEAVLREAFTRYRDRIALVSSFGAEAAVLLHMAAQIDKAVPVLFLDTGKLFPETLRYRDELRERLGLTDIRSLQPDPAKLALKDPKGSLWFAEADACCFIRKVEPLQRGLQPFAAWINGRKRFQAQGRAAIPVAEAADGRLKFNPLAGLTPGDIGDYFERHALPRHPLVKDGYFSIGCAPCSTPVAEGEDARAGRWRGQDKIECGIHLALPQAALTEE